MLITKFFLYSNKLAKRNNWIG